MSDCKCGNKKNKYDADTYITESGRTANLSETINDRLTNRKTQNLLHGVIGLCTESGELNGQIKKHLFYGTELDVTNIKEELGDILWYFALILRQYDWTFEEVMELNTNKLKVRYPDKFTEEKAVNRDLNKEREILEEEKELIKKPEGPKVRIVQEGVRE